jgi:hypothetical protein
MKKQPKCDKCGVRSGNDWSQCKGSCPMPMSPHYDTTLLSCENCGKKDGTVHVRIDPFMNEIHEVEEEVIWCDNCTSERAEEI